MRIRYLREVTSPHALAGAQWSEREIEDHLGRRLISEGYAEEVDLDAQKQAAAVAERQAQVMEILQRPIGAVPVAEAATAEPDDPTDVILEDGSDAT